MVGELFFFFCHLALFAKGSNFLNADEVCTTLEEKVRSVRVSRDSVSFERCPCWLGDTKGRSGTTYVHMDPGAFKLELAVTPLLNVFAGRLEAYKYMGLKKNINLRIEDRAQASEYHANSGADIP